MENEEKGSRGQWMKKKGGSNMDVEWLDHLWSREVEWGHVWMSAHLDWLSFITPKKGLRGYVGMGLLDIAEVAADVAVVGLGRPAAKVFDGVARNLFSGKSRSAAYREGVRRVKFGRHPLVGLNLAEIVVEPEACGD